MNANTTSTRPETSNPGNASGTGSLTDQAQAVASNVVDQAKSVASTAASQATTQVRGMLGGQIESGAEIVSNMAAAARQAAELLDKSNPQFAGMIRNAATAADQFSGQMRDTSLEELVELTTDFARRQPALFIGGAFACGFALARFAKSSTHYSARRT